MNPKEGPVGWEHGSGWGWVWGDDDEIGALNALGPDSVRDAVAMINEGKVYDLGALIDKDSYTSPFHVGTEVVAYRTPEGLVKGPNDAFDDSSGVSYNTSMVTVSDHAGTQLDGLCHATFGEENHWYNGFEYEESGRDFGPERAAAHNIPPIITSAALIDVAAEKGVKNLKPEFGITSADLKSALDSQGTEIHPGDAVFIRTGVMRHWGDSGSNHEDISGPDTAGLTLEGARWLIEEKGAMIVGADNSTVEVVPPVDGDHTWPVHKYLLVDQGVHMGELHNLEELAEDQEYRFCYIALVPKVRGITAGFAMRPVAVI